VFVPPRELDMISLNPRPNVPEPSPFAAELCCYSSAGLADKKGVMALMKKKALLAVCEIYYKFRLAILLLITHECIQIGLTESSVEDLDSLGALSEIRSTAQLSLEVASLNLSTLCVINCL